MKGFVYIITNKSNSDKLKVGFSLKDPELRAKGFNTATPEDNVVQYYALVDNPQKIERESHLLLNDCRYRKEREFFCCNIDTAIAAIKQAATGSILLEEDVREKIKETARKRKEIIEEIARERRERIKKYEFELYNLKDNSSYGEPYQCSYCGDYAVKRNDNCGNDEEEVEGLCLHCNKFETYIRCEKCDKWVSISALEEYGINNKMCLDCLEYYTDDYWFESSHNR